MFSSYNSAALTYQTSSRIYALYVGLMAQNVLCFRSCTNLSKCNFYSMKKIPICSSCYCYAHFEPPSEALSLS